MTATLTNTGSSACTTSSGADHGFAVSQLRNPIWVGGCSASPQGHTGEGMCPQYEQLQPLSAGQSLTRTQTWAQQRDANAAAGVAAVGAGSYTAEESWAGQQATAEFSIG